MKEVSSRVDTSRFAAALRELVEATGRSLPDVLRQNARLLAVSLASQTQPFSAGKATEARRQGENAVRGDIYAVYGTARSIYKEILSSKGGAKAAGAFWSALKRGDTGAASGIMRAAGVASSGVAFGDFDGGAAHQSRRNARGRVNRGGSSPRYSLLLKDTRELKKYIAKKMKNVGIAKSGWAEAAAALGGTRGIPAWVARHHFGLGGMQDFTKDANTPEVLLFNDTPYIRNVLNQGQADTASAVQQRKMFTYIDKILKYEASRSRYLAP